MILVLVEDMACDVAGFAFFALAWLFLTCRFLIFVWLVPRRDEHGGGIALFLGWFVISFLCVACRLFLSVCSFLIGCFENGSGLNHSLYH